MKKVLKKSRIKRTKNKKKPEYICYGCGTQRTIDNCGVGFTRLYCCGRTMNRK